MAYQNNSQKGGVKAKSKGTTKAGSTLKGTGTTKGKLAVKSGSQSSSVARSKTVGNNAGVSKIAGKGFHAQDIKSLIHNQGRANLGGQVWCLKAPSWSDSTLQAIISDPKLTARPTGKPAADGRVTFELRGHGKTINVTIGH